MDKFPFTLFAPFFVVFLLLNSEIITAQPVPSEIENIPHLVLFGKNADGSWGDCYHSQKFFFLIPKDFKKPVYIRVFDPECDGSIDELNGKWDTKTEFSVYGGLGCWTEPDAREPEPKGKYKSGTLLASKTFGSETTYAGKWYTFGPINPSEGEFSPEWGGFIIKIIAEAISGDDGNLYNYYLSTEPDKNVPVEGGNSFTYAYIFQLWNDPNQVSHIFPYAEAKTITVEQWNYDWDDDGFILIASVSRVGELVKASGNAEWKHSSLMISEAERGHSIDIQMHKQKNPPVKNNNLIMYIKNQSGQALPYFTIPIGGVPQPKVRQAASPR
jgi:hypothetical protein